MVTHLRKETGLRGEEKELKGPRVCVNSWRKAETSLKVPRTQEESGCGAL